MGRHPGRGLLFLGAIGALAWATASPGAKPSAVADLAWLAGCWEGGSGGRRIEEYWMEPRGGTMLGMNRTVRGDSTADYEHLMIREEAGRLVYIALPSGQARASFGSIEATPSRIVFENPAHDFPQRIIYERRPDGSLLSRIEGERQGKARGVDFPMRRVRCPDGPAPPAGRDSL